MSHPVLNTLAAIAGVLALCGAGYYALCIWSARTFLRDCRRSRERNDRSEFTPPVSILKPLRGTDPAMYEAFRSHCLQDYPEYELIFGVSEADDPAAELVARLKREFPERRIELVVCPRMLGANLKVSNLVQMLPQARYEYLLVNDSDIRVPRGYLRRVMAPLADAQVGMVTSLYRGAAGRTVGSKLEAVGISTDFAAGVLAARQIEGVHFALGATLGFPRSSLNAIGGFEPLLDYLADDYELGARISAVGHEVAMADVVVDTHVPDYDFGGYWNHQLRWARSTRDSRRWGHLGLVLTFGLPWALIALALSRGQAWAWGMLAVAAVVRVAMALAVGKSVLRDPQIPGDLWLLPLRDVLALLIWIASYAGRTVAWRGDQFILEDGKLKAVEAKG
ncbi:MAG: bacteriohopanetetrol glucosamine biosynthesis glycosyltransferase HpnI [Terriglobales bacterium]